MFIVFNESISTSDIIGEVFLIGDFVETSSTSPGPGKSGEEGMVVILYFSAYLLKCIY